MLAAAIRMRRIESFFMAVAPLAELLWCDEARQIALQFDERLAIEVRHRAGVEMADSNVVRAHFGRDIEVRERELGGVERRVEIEVVYADEEAQIRLARERVRE